MNDIRDRSPVGYISSLERLELRCGIEALSFPDYELMKGINVHELIVASFTWFYHLLFILFLVLFVYRCLDSYLIFMLNRLAIWKCKHTILLELVLCLCRYRHECFHINLRQRLEIKLDSLLLISRTCLYFSFNRGFFLIIEPGSSDIHWRGSFVESWSQVDVFGNETFVQQLEHAFVYVVFVYWWGIFVLGVLVHVSSREFLGFVEVSFFSSVILVSYRFLSVWRAFHLWLGVVLHHLKYLFLCHSFLH